MPQPLPRAIVTVSVAKKTYPRLFIGTSGTYRVGVVADAVLGLRRIPVANILPPPLGGDSAVEHLLGVAEGASTQEAIALLHFSKLLQSARQRAVVR